MGLYALWGPIQVAAGPITPLIFLAALLMTLPTALSYATLNAKAPSAGAAANWLWVSVSPAAGYLAGLAMATYFFMAAVAQPLMFALFFRDLLNWLHFEIPELPALLLGVFVGTVPIALITLRGAEASIKTTVRLMVVETLVVVALSITILIHKGGEPGGITLSAFDPHQAMHGFRGFWAAMILGVLAFAGFDVVSTAAEEAQAPREYIPKAILMTVVGIALFWAINAWVFTLSIPHEDVAEYTAHGLTAVTPVATAYWGSASIIVIATAFSGITAVYISCVQGASRIVFAMARHRLLPASLGRLHGDKHIPRNSVLAILCGVVALDMLALLALENGLDGFTWWANALVFFAILTFFAVNAANLFYFLRIARAQFSVIQNLIIPIIGMVLNAYLLHAAFFSSLWSADVRTGKSVVIACVALFAAQAIGVLYVRLTRRNLFSAGPPIGVDTAR